MTIDLSCNNLPYIPAGTFRFNPHLKDVNLSQNAFVQLSFNFAHLSNLSVLDLRNNRISYLDPNSRQKVDAFYRKHTETILTILLDGNPFSCGCEALEFLQWFITSPIFNLSYACYLGGSYIPLNEAAVDAAKEECDRPKRRLRNILLSTILPAVAFVVSVSAFIKLHKRYKRKKLQRRFEDRIRLIQDDTTGFTFTVFLSYCSLDGEFVVRHIRQPLEV